MNCNEFEDKISLYMDGELCGDERESVENHLESCPACKKVYDEFKSIDGLIYNIPQISPEKINAHDFIGKDETRGVILPVFNFRRLALAGAFLILMALGLFMAKGVIFPPSLQPMPPAVSHKATPEVEITRSDYDVRLNDTAYNVSVEGEGVRMISFDLTINDVEGVSMEFASEE